MSSYRRSAHGIIAGEVVQPFTTLAKAVQAPTTEFEAHIAPPSIYAKLCADMGFDPSRERDERLEQEEHDRRMHTPVSQW